MKLEASEPSKKKKNPTVNFPPDEHFIFCKRCYKHNQGCVNTGTKIKDPECRA